MDMAESWLALTSRKDLRELMRLEFHDDEGGFEQGEPDNYLERLTGAQKDLLRGPRTRRRLLTAFIVFGDGRIDRPLGGGSLYPGTEVFRDSLRPNASLALFHKGDDDAVQLVFYTRSLMVSYTARHEADRKVRAECRKLDEATDSSQQAKIRIAIFKAMLKLGNVRALLPVDSTPSEKHRYHFALHSHLGGGAGEPPYIRLWTSNRKEPGWFGRGNSLHGRLDTKGCWMLLRNRLWGWPREDHGQTYVKLAKAYLKYRRHKDSYVDDVKKDLREALGVATAPTEHEIFELPLNPAYLMFLRTFTGMRYNSFEKAVARPWRAGRVVRDGANSCNRIKTNLTETNADCWAGHSLQLMSGNLAYSQATISGYDPESKVLTLREPLRATPDPDSGFVLHHAATVVQVNSPTSFKTDLLEGTDDFWGKGEHLRFTSGNVTRDPMAIRGYSGATKTTITLEPPGLGKATLRPGSKFQIDNCWGPPGRPEWGPNAFGETFKWDQFWADVFIFRRSDRFTEDRGDIAVFS